MVCSDAFDGWFERWLILYREGVYQSGHHKREPTGCMGAYEKVLDWSWNRE